MKYYAYCDASYKSKIGASIAIIITNSSNTIINSFSEFVPIYNYKKTNVNNVELLAISTSLKILYELNLTKDEIIIYSDSQACIDKISSSKSLAEEMNPLIQKFTSIQFKWQSRKESKLVHRLCYDIITLKTREKRARRIMVEHKEGDIYLTQSTGKNKKIYEVNYQNKTCTCIHFKKSGKCRHLDAVIFKHNNTLITERI